MSDHPRPLETSLLSDDVTDLQHEVQRLLGRCLLRLQQYERLVKAIVVHNELAGPANLLEEIQNARIQSASRQTLGSLIRKFAGNCLVAEGAERETLGDNTANDVISFGFRMNISVPAEVSAHIRDGLQELVGLRNGLVHHFIEQYDLWQADGCAKAREYLIASYARIDGHYEQLRSWAKGLEQGRQLTASFMQSPEFYDLLVNGIAPDDTVD